MTPDDPTAGPEPDEPEIPVACPRSLGDLTDAIHQATQLRALHALEHNLIVTCGLEDEDPSGSAAAQLAVGLGLMEQWPVLLVDANLRSPTLHTRFGVEQEPGFSDYVRGSHALPDATRATSVPTLRVMPAGHSVDDLMELLTSRELAEAVDRLRDRFRYVIVDTAPIAHSADGSLIASRANGVVVTLAAGRRTKDELKELQVALAGLSVPLSGVVIAEVDRPGLGGRIRELVRWRRR